MHRIDVVAACETFHANRTIRWRQRLCFWAGFLYYITTAVNVLVAPAFLVLMFCLVPAYFSLQTRAWELCAGAALAMLRHDCRDCRSCWPARCRGLGWR